jgi:uncharacterized zinc-type alcohol dehydrogenase-like protein
MTTSNALAYAARDPRSGLAPLTIPRRAPGARDVEIDVLFCGVCHSDLHTARDEWTGTLYPCVPGHEIVGRVARVGGDVAKFRPGDTAAVGCMVDSCRDCSRCRAGEEQYCLPGATLTYNSDDKRLGGHTFGGYSSRIVVDEAFVLRVPRGLDLAAAAPLLCAGITTYSPLRRWKAGPGTAVGVVGLGGLGHMGVKLARAFGAHVVLFTTSPGKVEDGLRLGAHEVVLSKDADAMAKREATLDLVLDTVSGAHDLNAYLDLLRADGTLVLLGAPEKALSVEAFSLIPRRRSLSGSLIGGVAETQEMLDFCAERGIASEVEMIPIQRIDEAYERLLRQDVRYRFVIDMASLK